MKILPKQHQRNFDEVVRGFPELLQNLQKAKKHSIKELFKQGNGLITIYKTLGYNRDIPGIYVFYSKGTPFYVGISGGIFKRILQHVKGKNHLNSSLCYKIGAEKYLEEFGKRHKGGRKGLDFDKYGNLAKAELLECHFSFYQLKNDIELYLFEAYAAIALKTLSYNTFMTH